MESTGSYEELDSSVKEHLDIATFQRKFDVKNFIGGISDKLISESKGSSGPFDPQPFIRSFEGAVDKLIAIRKDVQSKSEQMERSVKVAEREYSRKMSDLNKGFEAVGQSFSGMETKMNEVGRSAIRIGEQLESVHVQRQRAQAAHDLINYYIQFSRDDTSSLDVLRKQSGKEGRRQLATILRRLSIVAKEVDLPNAEQTREAIEKYCEKFEKDMLTFFDKCYRKEDPKMMHHCAQTLQDFNGGASCVQIYVNQHDFFINRVQQKVNFNDEVLWKSLSDPDAVPPKSEKGLVDLFREIRGTVGEEAQIVQVVFPNPPIVMQVFLQRVFAQSIQQYMEQLLNNASGSLSFLRILQLVHVQASSLVEDLKIYELSSATPRSPTETAELRRSLEGLSAVTASSTTNAATISLTMMLENAMEELFVPSYTEGTRYLDRESKSLDELYTNYLAPFTRFHERTRTKTSMFDRMVNQLSAAAEKTAATSGTSTSAQAAAALMKFSGLSASVTQEKQEELREEDGLLSLDVAERMLRWHAEAVGRCIELSATGDVPKNAFALSRVLAEAIGTNYAEIALLTATERLKVADGKTEPSLNMLSVLRLVDLICHLWQQYLTTALLPLTSSSVTVRREMVVFNNQTVSRIEGAANNLLQTLTDAIVAWLALQLTKQKRNDFKPRNDDISFSRVNTEPCEACCEVLEKVRDAATKNLSGKNLEIFLTEVGVCFHSLLLEHLKKFPVNATGGLMLAKDLKSYQDVIATFNCPALPERFEFIRQLGNLFLVRPEILATYITDDYLGRIEPELLQPYLAQRSDRGLFEKTADGLGGEEIAGPEAKGFRERLGVSRLSTMMKELEGLRIGDGIGSMGSGLSGGFSLASRASRAFGSV